LDSLDLFHPKKTVVRAPAGGRPLDLSLSLWLEVATTMMVQEEDDEREEGERRQLESRSSQQPAASNAFVTV